MVVEVVVMVLAGVVVMEVGDGGGGCSLTLYQLRSCSVEWL